MIIVDENGDTVVEVVERYESLQNSNVSKLIKETAQFKVRKRAFIKASPVLLQMFFDPRWKEASQTVIPLAKAMLQAPKFGSVSYTLLL